MQLQQLCIEKEKFILNTTPLDTLVWYECIPTRAYLPQLFSRHEYQHT